MSNFLDLKETLPSPVKGYVNTRLNKLPKVMVLPRRFYLQKVYSLNDIVSRFGSSINIETMTNIRHQLMNEALEEISESIWLYYEGLAKEYYGLELNEENFHEEVIEDFVFEEVPLSDFSMIAFRIRTERYLRKNHYYDKSSVNLAQKHLLG